jgi:hypothetical protein
MTSRSLVPVLLVALAAASPGTAGAPAKGRALPATITFDSSQPPGGVRIALADVAPRFPRDFSGYEALVLEVRASSPQRIHLRVHARDGAVEPRPLPPLPGGLAPGRDPRVHAGPAPGHRARHGGRRQPLPRGLLPRTVGPVRPAHGRRGDRLRDGAPDRLADARGARHPPREGVPRGRRPRRPSPRRRARAVAHGAWPGKARSVEDLRGLAGRGPRPSPRRLRPLPLRGFATTEAEPTGFFRVERRDGRWWFV